jgi:hypothetical protein
MKRQTKDPALRITGVGVAAVRVRATPSEVEMRKL